MRGSEKEKKGNLREKKRVTLQLYIYVTFIEHYVVSISKACIALKIKHEIMSLKRKAELYYHRFNCVQSSQFIR